MFLLTLTFVTTLTTGQELSYQSCKPTITEIEKFLKANETYIVDNKPLQKCNTLYRTTYHNKTKPTLKELKGK